MGGVLACLFVGHDEKAEKPSCSPSPSRRLDTPRPLTMNLLPAGKFLWRKEYERMCESRVDS